MKHPFFTIITATYNAAATLPRLLDSLASQTCRDFNWIVQDGASSDTTMQIVDAYTEKLPSVLAESVTDKGIYDAWNKALDRTLGNGLGKWVLFLGADDLLADLRVLEKVKYILESFSEDIILAAGDIEYFSDFEKTVSAPLNISENFKHRNLGMPLPHTGLFARKDLFECYPFNPRFKIAGDYDWLLRVWKKPYQARALNVLVTQMALGGISSSEKYEFTCFKERNAVLCRHFPRTFFRALPQITLLYVEKKMCNQKQALRETCKKNSLLLYLWGLLSKLRKLCIHREY